jgi:hypothetical protein
MKIAPLLLLFLTTMPFLVVSREPTEKEVSPSIQLFSEAGGAGKGLLVEIVAPAVLPADRKAVFSYRITNLLEDEVFVELPSDFCAGHHYEGPDGGTGAGGGSVIVFPDNVNLLKRLHASSYKTGERFTCGCATVTSRAYVQLPEFATAKGKVRVTLLITGFYRPTGKAFCESIELPLPLEDK